MMQMTTYGDPKASVVLVQMVDDHDLEGIENEVAKIQELAGSDFCLLALKVRNWNTDLSPWEAPPVFGKEPFGGKAESTLGEVVKLCNDPDKTYLLGGYSLSGLFALWTAYQTDIFQGVAAASPSVWFPGFEEYMGEHQIRTGTVYLSLGDKEERARNPVMATVGEKIRRAQDILQGQGVKTVLEWNQGNHFREPDLRTAKAFAWVMKGGKDE